MNITELAIDGFGNWNDLKLEIVPDGLSVYYGPNETGKTTLMQFVRTVFYGLSADRRQRYYPPVHGGRAGGSMAIATGQGRYVLSRFMHPEDGPQSLGRLTVTTLDGTRQPERLVSSLLGHVDEPTFNHVFGVGMNELQELGLLGDTAAADLLYKLAAGIDRVSLVDVIGDLDASRQRLVYTGAGAQPSLIPQLVSQRDQLRATIQQMASSGEQYTNLLRRREELNQEITQLEARRAELERRAELAEIANGLRDKWFRRGALDRQLSELGTLRDLPVGAVEQAENLAGQIKLCRERLSVRRAERAKLAADLRKAGSHRGVSRHAARIEMLADQRHWVGSLEKEIQDLQSELANLQAKRAVISPVQSLVLDASVPAPIANLTDDAYRSLRQCARDVVVRRRRLVQAKALARKHREQAEVTRLTSVAQTVIPEGELRRALEDAGARVTQLRKRLQIDERLSQMSRQRREVEENNFEMYDRQLLPSWVLVGLGALFVFGLALLLSGLVLPKNVTGSMGWGLALVGFGGAAIAGLVKMFLEQNAEQDYEEWHKQKRVLHGQFRQLEEERDQLDRLLPRGTGPLAARLQEAERQLADLEAQVPVQAQKRVEKVDVNAPLRALKESAAQLKGARERWQHGLRGAGLPPKTTPRQLRRWVSGHRRWKRETLATPSVEPIEQQHERRRLELAERQEALSSVTHRVIQLSTELGLPLVSMAPVAQIDRLKTALEDHRKVDVRRLEMRRRLSQLRSEVSGERRQLRDLLRQRSELFRGLPVSDDESLRHLALRLVERDRVREQFRLVNQEVHAALVGRWGEDDVRPLFDQSPTLDLEHEWETCTARLEDCRKQLHNCLESRGAINQQLKALAEDRSLGHKQVELGIVEQRLREAAEQWRVVTLTGNLVDRVRTLYERDRQPESLASASQFLQQLTDGKYVRVWTPFGQRTLRVDDAQGRTLPVEVLSRGTRELLFLSLRLSLAEMYRRRGVDLPLVLDDLLVNFDSQRARSAATVLREFADRGHQILMFTCHEHLVKLFKSLRVPVRDLPTAAMPREEVVIVQAAPEPLPAAPLYTPVVEAPQPKVRRRRRQVIERPVPVTVVERVETPLVLEAPPWLEFDDPPVSDPLPRAPRPIEPAPRVEHVIRREVVDEYDPWTGAWLVEDQVERIPDEPTQTVERVEEATTAETMDVNGRWWPNGGRWGNAERRTRRNDGGYDVYDGSERWWSDERRDAATTVRSAVEIADTDADDDEPVERLPRRRRSRRYYYRRHRIDRGHTPEETSATDLTMHRAVGDAEIELTDAAETMRESIRETNGQNGQTGERRRTDNRYPRRTRRRRYVRRFVNNESAEEFRGEFNERTVRRVARPEGDDTDAA